jgi:hypothetical protein
MDDPMVTIRSGEAPDILRVCFGKAWGTSRSRLANYRFDCLWHAPQIVAFLLHFVHFCVIACIMYVLCMWFQLWNGCKSDYQTTWRIIYRVIAKGLAWEWIQIMLYFVLVYTCFSF